MKAKVTVKADELGNVIKKSENNPEYGHIGVVQTRVLVDDKGFARVSNLHAIIPGKIEDLKAFGWEAGEQIEGKVVIKESLTPFNNKSPERDYKFAGDTGIVCCQDGQPIYRKHIFSFSLNAEDVSVEHTNGEEISEAYSTKKENVEDENFDM